MSAPRLVRPPRLDAEAVRALRFLAIASAASAALLALVHASSHWVR